MKEVKITQFNGGLSTDFREPSSNKFTITKHFDIFSYPFKLKPYRSTEAGTTIGVDTTALKQYDVRTFQLGSDGALYGIGIQPSSTTRVKVLKNADPTDSVWTTPATAEGGLNGSSQWRNCFIEWQGAFWMFGGTTSVSKWVMGGTFTDTVASVGATITHVAQGVIAKDNNLYMFYNNKVVRVNSSGTVTDAVLTLPSDGRITNACVYGNYLAIAWAKGTTLTSGGYSKVFLWDLISPDVSESIDWGEGQLMVLANLEERLVGITNSFLSSSYGLSNGALVIRMYAGGSPSVVQKVIANATTTLGRLLRDVVVKENKLYFVGSLAFYTSHTSSVPENLGIYCFGRRDSNSNYALTLDTIDENIPAGQFYINSFGNAGNIWWINYSNDGSVSKTNDQATYSFTSIYESQVFTGGDSSKLKKLLGVATMTAPLPTNGQVVMKYKRNSDTSWTTIFTETTDNAVQHEASNIEASGVDFPDFYEIQFRIESTGGAEITGFKFQYEEINGLLN